MNAELLVGNIAAHWLQAGTLAASALVAMRLLNLNEPRARLAALQLVLIAILLLPLQPWRSEARAQQMTTFAAATKLFVTTIVDASAVISETDAIDEADAAPWIDPAVGIVAILAAGTAMRLLWLFYGVVSLARFGRRSAPVPPPSVARALEADLAVSPRYIQQAGSRGSWTFGFVRPTVALPAAFDALIPAFQRSVICHELVHVKRRDMAVAFCEELAVAALWFHPWVWLLRARIRVAREQVVDGRVVAMLGNRDDYVRCLVDISGHDLAPHLSQAGAGMLRPRELRARVDAIFQEAHMSRMRVAAAALAFVAVMVATGLIAVAAMPLQTSDPLVVSGFSRTPAAQSPTAPDTPRKQINMVYPDYPQDALERGIRGTVAVEITVNAAGEVTTAAVASGPQELHASAFKAALGLKYTPGPSTATMRISIDYTLTGNSWGVRIGDAAVRGGTRVMMTSKDRYAPAPTGALRVGGDVRPPIKLKDMAPDYPAIAQQARVQGVVILEVRIDEQGNVTDARPLRSIPLLDEAAIGAVKQWQYEPTLMNGVAVPIIMTVTVNFSLRDLIQLQVLLSDSSSIALDMPAGALLPAPGGRFQLRASRSRGSNDVTVSVFTDDGQTHLSDVGLTLDGPIVQSPTTPSFGLRLLGVR
jgi:TonB family protein